MSSKFLKSPLSDVDIPLISISKFLLQRMRIYGDNIFLIEYMTGKSYTFNQFVDDCLRMANVWIHLGLKENQVYAICGDNSYDYLVCLLSGIFIGAVALPMRGNNTIHEITSIIQERGINTIAISGEILKSIEDTDLYNQLTGVVFNYKKGDHSLSSYEELMSSTNPIDENQLPEPSSVKECVCLMLESSGTTGPPKGCMFSHFNLVALVTIGSLPEVYGRTSDDIVSGHSTMALISGINQLIMSLSNGSKLILQPKFDFDTVLNAIEKYRITAATLSAPVIVRLIKMDIKNDIRSLRKLICGSAPLPKGYGQLFVEKYTHIEVFKNGYGMTEMTILTAFDLYGSKNYDSVGLPTPGNTIKVIDTNDGQLLDCDLIGEICVKGPTLFKGYHNNPKATSQSFDGEFLKTGDLGYYDSEGYIYIVDRLKHILKINGMQVSAIELEALFLTHEAIEDVAVVGISDPTIGDLPTAFVVLKDQCKNYTTSEQLLKYINDRIADHKQIRGGVHLVESLPKNSLGKVIKYELIKSLHTNQD